MLDDSILESLFSRHNKIDARDDIEFGINNILNLLNGSNHTSKEIHDSIAKGLYLAAVNITEPQETMAERLSSCIELNKCHTDGKEFLHTLVLRGVAYILQWYGYDDVIMKITGEELKKVIIKKYSGAEFDDYDSGKSIQNILVG